MAVTLLLVFLLICFGVVAWAFADPPRMLSSPFQIAAASLFFVIPQLCVIVIGSTSISPEMCSSFTLYCICALIANILGFNSRKPLPPRYRTEFDHKKLNTIAMIVTLSGFTGWFGLQMHLAIYGQPKGLWTGIPVYLYTLSRLLIPGLVFARTLSLTSKNRSYQYLSAIAASPILYLALVNGRRSWMLMFIFAWFMPAIMMKRIKIRKWHGIAMIAIAFLVTTLFPAYRMEIKKNGWHGLQVALRERSPKQVLSHYFSGTQTLEIADAICCFKAIESEMRFSYGLRTWDCIVQSYIPGTLIGKSQKDRFRSGVPSYETLVLSSVIKNNWTSRYRIHFFTAKTGFVDSFAEFWWLGLLIYFYLGRFWKTLYRDAVELADPSAILVVAFLGFLPAGVVYVEFSFLFATSFPIFAITYCARKYAIRRIPIEHKDGPNSKVVTTSITN